MWSRQDSTKQQSKKSLRSLYLCIKKIFGDAKITIEATFDPDSAAAIQMWPVKGALLQLHLVIGIYEYPTIQSSFDLSHYADFVVHLALAATTIPNRPTAWPLL